MALNITAVSTSRVYFPDNTAFIKNVAGYTACCWVYPVSTGNSRSAISISRGDNTASPRCDLLVAGSGGTLMAYAGRALDSETISSFGASALAVSLNIWQFIGVTVNCVSRVAKLFLNNSVETSGTLTNMTSGNTSNTNPQRTSVGNHPAGTTPGNAYFDDCRIYNRTLSENEMFTIYGCNGVDSIVLGLEARLLFSEKTEGTVTGGGDAVIDDTHTNVCNVLAGSIYQGSPLKYRRAQK